MIYIVLVIVGLAFGSFINALVWRIHEQETSAKKRKDPKLSVTKGRSMCPSCKHELAAKDLIPVFSWLSLGGKCRYCKKSISVQYPVVEVSTAILFAHSYYANQQFFDTPLGKEYPVGLLVVWLAMLIGMIALFVYDLRWMILPDRIVFPILGLATSAVIYEFFYLGMNFGSLLAAALGVLVLGGLFYTLFVVSKGRWIGGGDVKFGIFMGILLGPLSAYLALLIASLTGSIVILTLMALKVVGRKQLVPFGPFLIVGTYIAAIYGQTLINWYSDNFLGGLL